MRLKLASFNIGQLFVAVHLFAFDEQLLALPLRLLLKFQELFRELFALKLDKDTSLEHAVRVASPQTNAIDRAIRRKEALDIKLGRLPLVTETFGVDGSWNRGIAKLGVLDGLLPCDSATNFVTDYFNDGAFLERRHDSGVWLETLHALERVDLADGDGLVVVIIVDNERSHIVIVCKIRIRKVKVNLFADLIWVRGFGQDGVVSLDVVLEIGVGALGAFLVAIEARFAYKESENEAIS